MKDNFIQLINRKIREMQFEVEVSKKAQDLVRVSVHQKVIKILSALIQEIQATL